MNIFEALSNGKGCINEENTTSFLGYLLNPLEDHGMKDTFTNLFLKEIIHLPDEGTNINEFDVQLEVPVKDTAHRLIDIVFQTKHHVVAIENKIKIESCQENQLVEEYNGLCKYVEETRLDKKVNICLLLPKNLEDIEKKYQKDIPNDNIRFITWSEITELLQKILELESQSKINPIGDYVKQTTKAFINFIGNIIEDEPKKKIFKVQGEEYRISLYPSKKVTIEHILPNNEFENVSARNIIRQKLDEYKNTDNKCSYENTEPYNTRYLGDKLFKLEK